MNNAFTREPDSAPDDALDDDEPSGAPVPHGARNYITPAGYARLRANPSALRCIICQTRYEKTFVGTPGSSL